MAVSSISLSLSSTTSTFITTNRSLRRNSQTQSYFSHNTVTCSTNQEKSDEQQQGMDKRRNFLLGGFGGALSLTLFPATSLFAQEVPKKFEVFIDKEDGYSYFYPSDWRDFDFRGHDSAFKDRYLQLQNVRLSFLPTTKSDIHDLGPMEEVISNLVRHIYSAPSQVADIMNMTEKSIDGKNYYTFEYILTSKNFSRAAFATIAIANGRHYTLIVGANERRWKRVRNQLKVVADSFRVFDI